MIAHNPCERADPPKLKRQEPVFLNELQAGRILQLLEDEEIQFRTAIPPNGRRVTPRGSVWTRMARFLF